MPAGGMSNLAFNLAQMSLCPRRALPSGWATARRARGRRAYMHYFDWDRVDAEQDDKAEAAEQGSAPAPPAASRVASGVNEECQ